MSRHNDYSGFGIAAWLGIAQQPKQRKPKSGARFFLCGFMVLGLPLILWAVCGAAQLRYLPDATSSTFPVALAIWLLMFVTWCVTDRPRR